MRKLTNKEEQEFTDFLDHKLGKLIEDKLKSVLAQEQDLQHKDFDFEDSADDDTTPVPKPQVTTTNKDGALPLHEMRLDKTRTLESRQAPLWRKSCEYWLTKFQEMGQPICVWFSMPPYNDPSQADTVFIRDVGPEMVEITKIAGANTCEKSWRYQYIYGLEIPDNRYRKKAKERMHEWYKIPLEDTEEFLKLRETTIRTGLKQVKKTAEKKASSELTKEAVGERYERQLEWHFNMEGYHVDTHGLKERENDNGVDHILVKNGKVDLIQAKAISKSKELSSYDVEAMFNQMKSFYEKNKSNTDLLPGDLDRIVLVVANGDSLPEETREHATKIGLVYKVVPYKDKWPEIKCVISGKGEKRFYRPSDQHWMGCNMLADRRRFWVFSIEEAQSRGYKPSRATKVKKL